MHRPGGGRRLQILGAIAAIALLVAGGLHALDLLRPAELATIDARYALRGNREAPPGIVIVALDGRTLTELGESPPLPRAHHARLLRIVDGAGPRLVAEDFQFIGRKGPVGDRALAEALREAAPVILATHTVPGPPLRVPAGRTPQSVGAIAATVELIADADGKIRRARHALGGLPSFPAAIVEQLRGRAPGADRFPAWLDFRGPPGTFPTYSFSDVLQGAVPPSVFRDKLVLVGATDPIQKDVFPTPASDVQMPGVEIHATAVATILDGFPLREAPAWVDVLLLVAGAGLAPGLAAARRPPALVLAAGLVALAALAGGAQLAFAAGWIVPVLAPGLALFFATAATVAAELQSASRERAQLRRAFARFVPEQVIEDVVARTDDDLRLGGVTLEATVLFCDLRGFTAFAETHSGATVIETLNRYLTEMSDALLAHGGTVVAYMGDGIMAVFGAPIEQPDNARRAVAAARAMVGPRLETFNAWVRERGLGDGFALGIGLSTGPVRSGNVGSEQRLEYAAVGDTTNVAARLEAHSKQTPYQVVLAGTTRAQLAGDDDLVALGTVVLRGRQSPTELWGLASTAREPAPAPHAGEPRSPAR